MRLTSTLLIALIASACAPGGSEQPSPSSSVVTTIPSAGSSTSISTTSTTQSPGPAVAMIAPSGVPLAVTSIDAEVVRILTPCGAEGVISAGKPIYEVDVVLDPGHGGPVDTGAVGANRMPEKEINLRVSLAAQKLLEARGIATVLTRTGDYPIVLPVRAEYADLMGAEVLVSIHHNAPAAPASAIPGVEIFVQHESEASKRLGGVIYERAMTALSTFDIDWDRAPDAGVMTVLNPDGLDAYGMIRLPETTSVLVELGYIANPAEARLYESEAYVDAAARAIADGIESFLTSDDAGEGHVEGRVFRPNAAVGRDQCVEPDLNQPLYPDVVSAEAVPVGDNMYRFDVTVSSPYDSPERYADAWRVRGRDGEIYGIRELLHDHAGEQPFTRSLPNVSVPPGTTVLIEARDSTYGWGGASIALTVP